MTNWEYGWLVVACTSKSYVKAESNETDFTTFDYEVNFRDDAGARHLMSGDAHFSEGLINSLNDLGDEGWEVVSVRENHDTSQQFSTDDRGKYLDTLSSTTCLLKRPRP